LRTSLRCFARVVSAASSAPCNFSFVMDVRKWATLLRAFAKSRACSACLRSFRDSKEAFFARFSIPETNFAKSGELYNVYA